VTTQLARNPSPAMNQAFSGTTTNDNDVILKALASMRANADSISIEIDESQLQDGKYSERII
jgi:hypothetical protein